MKDVIDKTKSNKSNEHNVIHDGSNKNQLFLSEETQRNLKDLIPDVSSEEILFSNTPESKSADKMIIYFGKIIGKFEKQENLNLAMRILSVANEVNARYGDLSKFSIYQSYCSTYDELDWDHYEGILKRIAGKSSMMPLEIIGVSLKFTQLGRFLLLNYQKLKADVLAMQKYGSLQDIFAMIDDVRSFWNYGQYGMEIEYIFSLTNNLKNLLEKIRTKGNEILRDSQIDIKINVIHDIIDQILKFQDSDESEPKKLTLHQKIQITTDLVIALKELTILSRKKFDFKITRSKEKIIETPFSEMENYFLINWDDIEWNEIFYSIDSCCIPVQYSMKINEFLLKRALISFFEEKAEIYYSELPEYPSEEISEKPIDELLVAEEELMPIKNKLLQKAFEMAPCSDYEIVQDRNPSFFLNNLLLFYLLACEEEIHVHLEVNNIHDPHNNIEQFSSRIFEINEESNSEIEEAFKEINEEKEMEKQLKIHQQTT